MYNSKMCSKKPGVFLNNLNNTGFTDKINLTASDNNDNTQKNSSLMARSGLYRTLPSTKPKHDHKTYSTENIVEQIRKINKLNESNKTLLEKSQKYSKMYSKIPQISNVKTVRSAPTEKIVIESEDDGRNRNFDSFGQILTHRQASNVSKSGKSLQKEEGIAGNKYNSDLSLEHDTLSQLLTANHKTELSKVTSPGDIKGKSIVPNKNSNVLRESRQAQQKISQNHKKRILCGSNTQKLHQSKNQDQLTKCTQQNSEKSDSFKTIMDYLLGPDSPGKNKKTKTDFHTNSLTNSVLKSVEAVQGETSRMGGAPSVARSVPQSLGKQTQVDNKPIEDITDVEFKKIIWQLCCAPEPQTQKKCSQTESWRVSENTFPSVATQIYKEQLNSSPEYLNNSQALLDFDAEMCAASVTSRYEPRSSPVLNQKKQIVKHQRGRPFKRNRGQGINPTSPASVTSRYELRSCPINQVTPSKHSIETTRGYRKSLNGSQEVGVLRDQSGKPRKRTHQSDTFKGRRGKAPKRPRLNLENDFKIKIFESLTQESNVSNSLDFIKVNLHKIGTEKWLQSIVSRLDDPIPKNLKAISVKTTALKQNITRNSYTKRYRKGKVRIYRLEKRTVVKAVTDLDSHQLVNKLTQDYIEDEDLYIETIDSTASTPSSYVSYVDLAETLSTGSDTLLGSELKLRIGMNEITKNKELVLQGKEIFEIDARDIQKKIHDLFVKLHEICEHGGVPLFEFVTTCNYKNCSFVNDMLQVPTVENTKITTKISYKNSRSRFKFCIMLYLLAKIYTLLKTNTKLTKREIFYQIKPIVSIQSRVDNALNDVCHLLNVGQWHLNILSGRGLVYGDLKLITSSGDTIDCNIPKTMIPCNLDSIIEVQSTAYFILVVEKESIFQKLLDEDLPNKLSRPFIMITGKGVPDFNTQVFLKKLCNIMSLPVFILVDPDPYGIKIMLNYRFGAAKNAFLAPYLAVPNARWLGVFPSEIVKLGVKFTQMSERDRKLAENITKYPYMAENPEILEEVHFLLKENKKASIEGLIKSHTFLSESYLPSKFFNQDFC